MAKKETIKWSLGLLEETFSIKRLIVGIDEMPVLTEWLGATGTLTDEEDKELDFLRKNLDKQVDNWDEEALKMNFIAFILRMTYYLHREGAYQSYFDKIITATIDKYTISSKPDMLLAKGIEDEMQTPYFCFHEYKKSKPDKDPRAQLLLDMLIAQQVNQNGKPLYGCYVAGGFWYFVVLAQKEFMISPAYNATKIDELAQIVFILRQFWVILEESLIVK